MISFNYQAPMYTFINLVDNINYLYEGLPIEKKVTYATNTKIDTHKKTKNIEVLTNSKERILTYYRNELLVMYTRDIAYVYIENSITYIVNMEGKKSIANGSLDNIFGELNPHFFFRVNRQIILRVSAIKKIIKMDNCLKVETYPPANKPIIVGKNKVLAFKKWLEE